MVERNSTLLNLVLSYKEEMPSFKHSSIPSQAEIVSFLTPGH